MSDPQRLPIPDVAVTLSCGLRHEAVVSDAAGRFAFGDRPSREGCVVVAEHAGFSTYRKRLRPETVSLQVRLELAPLQSSIEVVAPAEEGSSLLRPALGSVSLSGTELRAISNDTAELIRYAKLAAGVIANHDAVYVDGLPASSLPPANAIAHITVNADPFSAEYADGDYAHIEITTKSPDRQFRFNLGGTSLGVGGRDSLAPAKGSVARSEAMAIAGPVLHLPATFSVRANWSLNATPFSIQAILPPGGISGYSAGDQAGTMTNRTLSVLADVYYWVSDSSQLHFSYSDARSSGSNLGVGGLDLPDTASDLLSGRREGRLTVSKTGKRWIYRGGAVVTWSGSDDRAHSDHTGVDVLGSFVTGGPLVTRTGLSNIGWTLKSVLQSSSDRWSAGITGSGAFDSRDEIPNPRGVYTFATLQDYESAMAGAHTATWVFMQGDGRLGYRRTNVSPFFQKHLVERPHLLIIGGIRSDSQSGIGTLVSPRLSLATDWKKFVIRTGGGWFAREIPNAVFVRVMEGDGAHLNQSVVEKTPFPAESTASGNALVRTRLSPDLALPRELLQKFSVERPLGKFVPGVEYTWSRERHRLGSRRLPDGDGWIDLTESNRSAERHSLRSQLVYGWKTQRFTASYEWIHSRDNGDGPFSFAENAQDVHAEWARTAGVAPHNANIAGYFRLPGSVFLATTDTWHGSSPFNITVAQNPASDGLFNQRGGRPRNSGNAPGYNSLSAYASRRVPLPGPLGRLGHYATVGVNGDNLLGNKNYLSLGSVLGSPTFGRPLASVPGRSLRVWFNFN